VVAEARSHAEIYFSKMNRIKKWSKKKKILLKQKTKRKRGRDHSLNSDIETIEKKKNNMFEIR